MPCTEESRRYPAKGEHTRAPAVHRQHRGREFPAHTADSAGLRASPGQDGRASTPEEVFRQESESLSPPATFPAVPDGNCVIVRWGGEQPKGNDQSVG